MSRTNEGIALDAANDLKPESQAELFANKVIILAALNEATAHQENNLANAELQVQDLQAELRKKANRNSDLEAEAKMLRIQRDTLIHQRDQLSAENARLLDEIRRITAPAEVGGGVTQHIAEERDQLRAEREGAKQ